MQSSVGNKSKSVLKCLPLFLTHSQTLQRSDSPSSSFFLLPPSLPPRTSWLLFPFSLNPSEGLFHCLLLYVITGESGLLCILLAAKLKPLAPTLEQSLDTLGNTHICFLAARRGRDEKIDIFLARPHGCSVNLKQQPADS